MVLGSILTPETLPEGFRKASRKSVKFGYPFFWIFALFGLEISDFGPQLASKKHACSSPGRFANAHIWDRIHSKLSAGVLEPIFNDFECYF